MSSVGSSPLHSSDDEHDDIRDRLASSSAPRREPIKLMDSDESGEDEDNEPRRRKSSPKVKREASPRRRSSFDDDDEDEDDIHDGRDDNDDGPSPTKRPSSSHKSRSFRDDEDDLNNRDAYGSDGDDDDDDDKYRRSSSTKVKTEKKYSSKKKRDLSDDEYGDEDGEGAHIQQEKPKKRKKEEWDDAPPEGDEDRKEKKMSIFDKAVEKTKANRRRRNEPDPHVVESECVAFLERMKKARDDDLRAFKRGNPALEKIKMLRDVEKMMTKVYHREYLLDNMLLAAFRAWLDRLPDGSLPNIQVRTTLLNILHDLRIDEDWVERLEGSQGLGKVIHFLSRNDDHEPNKRVAEKIMMKWARPVYKMNSNFHELLYEFDKPEEGHRAGKESMAAERKAAMRTVQRLKSTEEKLTELRRGKDDHRVMAAVPRPTPFLFTTVAEGSTHMDEATERQIHVNKARQRRMNRTVSNLRRLSKQSGARGSRPSINGR